MTALKEHPEVTRMRRMVELTDRVAMAVNKNEPVSPDDARELLRENAMLRTQVAHLMRRADTGGSPRIRLYPRPVDELWQRAR